MKKIFFLLFVTVKYLLLPVNIYSQGVAINNDGTQPNSHAILDVKSPNKGALLPRMATTERMAIPVTADDAGLLVFDTDKQTLYLFDGQNWLAMAFVTNDQLPPVNRTASDKANGDAFGWSVSIDGDYAVVGAYTDDIGGNSDQGSAYIFIRNGSTWTEHAKLTANDGQPSDFFGRGVSINGDYVIVGAQSGDNGAIINCGSAYIFIRNGATWTQQAKLNALDGTTDDYFGSTVSISGDHAIVGAYVDDIGASTDQGSAYIFARTGSSWVQQAKLTSLDGVAQDRFGVSVSIDGNYAVVGAVYDDIGANFNQGSAYVYFFNGTVWAQQAKLYAIGGEAGDEFGGSVSINGSSVIVGASRYDFNANAEQGVAYVFIRNGTNWTIQSSLHAEGQPHDLFGSSVSISGDYAIVGAVGYGDDTNEFQGSAYLFKWTGTSWRFIRKITDINGDGGDFFANQGISIDAGRYIIGAPGKNAQGSVSFGTVD